MSYAVSNASDKASLNASVTDTTIMKGPKNEDRVGVQRGGEPYFEMCCQVPRFCAEFTP